MRADELATYYLEFERQLLTKWDVPLVNDILAIIFHRRLRVLAGRWCNDTNGALPIDLLQGQSGMVSTEPAKRIRQTAASVAADPRLLPLLCEGGLSDVLAAARRNPEFLAQFESYIEKFGDRCLEELKLESPALYDNPLLLLRSVGQLARSQSSQQSI